MMDISLCPQCSATLSVTDLICTSCETQLPFCIITGYHLIIDDWTQCPSCHFPALYSKLKEYLLTETHCPMCDQEISPHTIFLNAGLNEWTKQQQRFKKMKSKRKPLIEENLVSLNEPDKN